MVTMALSALVAAVNRHHRAIVHAAAPQIGETIEQAGMAGAFG